MQEKIKVYVRTDLKTNSGKRVPNGKMAAQSAHALMGGFLALFKKESEVLTSEPQNLELIKQFINGTVDVEYIPLKESEVNDILNNPNVIPIIDQGRTVFREPTLTTMVVMPESAKLNKNSDCYAESDSRYRSKQTLVIDKNHIKDKWEMFEIVSNASLKGLYNFAIVMENEVVIMLNNEGLSAWINGAFAKITLQPKEKTMIGLLEELNQQSDLNYSLISKGCELACISIGPDFVESVDKITKEGYSLV